MVKRENHSEPNVKGAGESPTSGPVVTLSRAACRSTPPKMLFGSAARPPAAVLARKRNLVERFFNQLKHFRAIATRYDKLARNFLAGVQLAAITILLN